MHALKKRAGEEWLFWLSLAGLFLSSLALRRVPHYTEDDFQLVFLLFGFLVIIRGLEKGGLLSRWAASFSAGRRLPLRLVALTGLLSPLVTNDVALLVMVPLTLAMEMEGEGKVIALEVIAANGASSLTPFGNPQNLFIYYHFGLRAEEFVGAIFPLSLLSTGLALLLAGLIRPRPRRLPSPPVERGAYPYLALLVLFLPVALKVLPLWVGLIPPLYALLWDRKALKVDYYLLVTFLCFFGFTDNIVYAFQPRLNGPIEAFCYPLMASQLISNVPSTLLFADFAADWRALLWGVNVGGFGTLLGSLASLIAYKLYLKARSSGTRFLLVFHVYNLLALALGVLLYFLLFGGQPLR